MVEKYDELVDEVENDIRHEKWKELWRKYGQKISAAFTVALVIGAGYTLWQQYHAKKRLENAAVFTKAQELISEGKIDKAVSALNTLRESSGLEYSTLARFLDAGALLKDPTPENTAKALVDFKELSALKGIDPAWRDLARFFAISLEMDSDGESRYDELLQQLEPLTAKGAPWSTLALELKGAILHQKGDITKAAEIFANLASEKEAPEGIRTRAQLMAQVLRAEIGE